MFIICVIRARAFRYQAYCENTCRVALRRRSSCDFWMRNNLLRVQSINPSRDTNRNSTHHASETLNLSRLPSDDAWVVPHNLYVHLRLRPNPCHMRALCMARPCCFQVSMFNPSTINVICFDPNHNSDQARGYAAKYCSKPEKWWANLCR